MEVSTEKSKIMTDSTNIHEDISMKSQKLEVVTSFKYLGAVLCKDGTSSAEISIRIASVTAATVRLSRLWWCITIGFIRASSRSTSLLLPPSSSVAVKH